MFKNVPKLFFKNPEKVKYLAGSYENCIIYKTLEMNSIQHDYYVSQHVVTLVLTGEKQMQLANGTRQIIPSGQFAYIPKDLYMIQDIIPQNSYFESWLFFFNDDICQKFLSGIPSKAQSQKKLLHANSASSKLLTFSFSNNLQAYIGGLQPILGNQPLNQSLVELKILELLHLLSLEKEGATFINQLNTLQTKERRSLTNFMEQHYTKPLKVEDYAFLTGRSLSSFLRDFKKHYQTMAASQTSRACQRTFYPCRSQCNRSSF